MPAPSMIVRRKKAEWFGYPQGASKMNAAAPALSVIVASPGPLRDIPESVHTLLESRGSREVEIILAYAADRELPFVTPALGSGVSLIRLPEGTALPQLLGAAIARAQGEILAISDAHCAVDRNWISATLAAHAAPHPVIGGAVEPDGLGTLVDWAGYFCDYGAFMSPLAPGVVRHVPGINLSMKRWALGMGREFVEGEFWKAFWCQQLKTKGYDLHIEPSMLVFYRRSFSFRPFLRLRFDHGRCFAGMRARRFNLWQRLLYLLGSPLLPLVFAVRFFQALVPKRRHVRYLIVSFPIVMLAMISWGLGEFCGYLLGEGTSCSRVR